LKTKFKVLYVPRTGTVIEHWRHVGTIAYAIGNLTLCIDEIGLLCERGELKKDGTPGQPILESIIHFGRHRNIEVIATTQRPTGVALRFRALCTEMIIFNTVEKRDLDYLEERVGAETIALLPTLPKYDYVEWKEDGSITQGRTEP
jgi:hypothetical protein